MDGFKPIRIYCCFSESARDSKLFKALQIHLATLIGNHQITLEHSGNVSAGDDQVVETVFQMGMADIILLLQSPDFLNSPFCLLQESYALILHQQRKTSIIPVLLRASDWEHSAIFDLTPLPDTKRTIASFTGDKRDQVLVNIALSIRTEVEKLFLLPRKGDYMPKQVRSVIFPPLLKAVTIEEFQRIGKFFTDSGFSISSKYEMAGFSSKVGEIISQFYPLGIPGYTPVSASINTSVSSQQNITSPVIYFSSEYIFLCGQTLEENIPYHVAGDIYLQY